MSGVWNREQLIQLIESRLWGITKANGYSIDISAVERNPVTEPPSYPVANIFEFTDVVTSRRKSGKNSRPTEKIRKFEFDIEIWRETTNAGLASQETTALHQDVIKAIEGDDGGLLGGFPAIEVNESRCEGPIFTTKKQNLAIGGMSITFSLHYSDS